MNKQFPKCIFGILLILFFATQPVFPQNTGIEFCGGYWNCGSTNATVKIINLYNVKTEVSGGGFAGSLTFSRWLENDIAFTLSFGGLLAEASSSTELFSVTEHVVSIFPIILGIRYSLIPISQVSGLRPYIAAGVGPYFGIEARNEVGFTIEQEAKYLATFGGNIGFGVDFLLWRHFAIVASGCYHFLSDYNEPLGGKSNFSGAEFKIGFAIFF